MSYISDFKGATFSLFGVNGGQTSTDQNCETQTGQKFALADGRTVALVQNGGTALTAGKLVQGPATIGANHTGLAVVGVATANPIGATSITVTLGGTVTTANQYQGGYAVVSAGTGIGQTLRIAANSAGTSSGSCVLTLEDPLSVAITSVDSKVSLTLPQYGGQNGTNFSTHGVVINPTTPTGRVLGVTLYPIPASTATVPYYGFIVTNGAVGCLNDASTTIGLGLMPSTNTPGAVMTYATTGNYVGTSTVAGETTKAQMITVML